MIHRRPNAPSVSFADSSPALQGSIFGLVILHRFAGEVDRSASAETEGALADRTVGP
jgi:hypothetical protein